MPHVIVEGPDGAGKSQFIEALGLPREHTVAFKPEYGHPLGFYGTKLSRAVPTGFDRLYLSELVYGPILRGKSAISLEQIDYLRGQFPRVPVVLCLPPYGICLLATRSRPWPEYQTDAFLEQSYHEWQKLAHSNIVDFVYNWCDKTLRPSRRLPAQLAPFALSTHV